MSWIAEYDTQGKEFPTCVHMTKTAGTLTHGVTYVPIEDGEAVRAENARLRELVRRTGHSVNALDEENAKLRELVMWAEKLMQGVLDNSTDTVVVSDLPCCDTLYDNLAIYRERMQELGIEVDG